MLRQGADWTARRVSTGLTDLDRVEILSGLAEGDQVALLPSSGLTESQEQIKDFIQRRGGIPGITQRREGAAPQRPEGAAPPAAPSR